MRIGYSKIIIVLLGLVLAAGCSPCTNAVVSPVAGSPDCRELFPKGSWNAVHRITVRLPGGSATFLGVLQGEPDSLRMVLMTHEGFTLLDAKQSPGSLEIYRKLPPFDHPEFVASLVHDVTLIFREPHGKLRLVEGACFWENGEQALRAWQTVDGGWVVEKMDSNGAITHQIRLRDKTSSGLFHFTTLEDRAGAYKLEMELIDSK